MSFRLTVPNIDPKVFYSYWYGTGEIVSVEDGDGVARDGLPTKTFVVDYGSDEYRCQYQDGRFGSGLYFSKVEEV